jgi:5-methylcytosine-specific restriction endonuclease McrA
MIPKPTHKFTAHERGRKWQRVRAAFLAKHIKDGGWYECAKCGVWLKYPEVDHIIKRSVAPHLVFDQTNFQILCHHCHLIKDSGQNIK